MRINEYNSLEEFTSEYIGVWGPSRGHWYGLDFCYEGQEYRLHTGEMYKTTTTILPDGREVLFGVYKVVKPYTEEDRYELLGEYADMDDLLDKCIIKGRKFRDVIMDDNTEMLGKD